jgi:hypothetical protein
MILYIAGAIAALIAVLVIIGSLLPRDHTATRCAHFHKPADTVFAIVTGPGDWRPELAKWERLDDRHFVETTRRGGHRMRMEVLELKAPTRYVTRIDDPSLPFGGTWTFEITPAGGGCSLRIREEGFVSNPIFRFISHYFMGHHATMETYLRSLGTHLGQAVRLEE